MSAEQIVTAIIADIEGRSGLGDAWEQIDPDIRAEIKAHWMEIAATPLGGSVPGLERKGYTDRWLTLFRTWPSDGWDRAADARARHALKVQECEEALRRIHAAEGHGPVERFGSGGGRCFCGTGESACEVITDRREIDRYGKWQSRPEDDPGQRYTTPDQHFDQKAEEATEAAFDAMEEMGLSPHDWGDR